MLIKLCHFLYQQNSKTATNCKMCPTHRFGLRLLMVRDMHLAPHSVFIELKNDYGFVGANCHLSPMVNGKFYIILKLC